MQSSVDRCEIVAVDATRRQMNPALFGEQESARRKVIAELSFGFLCVHIFIVRAHLLSLGEVTWAETRFSLAQIIES